jgi:hypothetical protein
VSGLELLSEPCFCHLKSIIVLIPNNGIASELNEKIRETCIHVVNLNITIDSLPRLQISLGIVALFEKISNGDPIITVVSNIGEDVQYRCCN